MILKCLNCGTWTDDPDTFDNGSDAWACPSCGMDESGLITEVVVYDKKDAEIGLRMRNALPPEHEMLDVPQAWEPMTRYDI